MRRPIGTVVLRIDVRRTRDSPHMDLGRPGVEQRLRERGDGAAGRHHVVDDRDARIVEGLRVTLNASVEIAQSSPRG